MLAEMLCQTFLLLGCMAGPARHDNSSPEYLDQQRVTMPLAFADACSRRCTSGYSCIHSRGHHLICSAGNHAGRLHTGCGASCGGCRHRHAAGRLQCQCLPHQHPSWLSEVRHRCPVPGWKHRCGAGPDRECCSICVGEHSALPKDRSMSCPTYSWPGP